MQSSCLVEAPLFASVRFKSHKEGLKTNAQAERSLTLIFQLKASAGGWHHPQTLLLIIHFEGVNGESDSLACYMNNLQRFPSWFGFSPCN